MKGRRGSISSCLSKPSSTDSLANMKLLAEHFASHQNQERKVSESSQQSSFRSWDNSFDVFCRICHDNDDDEDLMTACRCLGSIRLVHHRCLLHWISRSGELTCELCKYHFKVKRTRRKNFSEWQLPVIGIQGWLHIILFFAFLSMLLTSITWVIWSQTSSSSAAVFERTSAEIKYAYLLNGVFILTAVIGISLDSFRQAKKYFQRSLALNQELSIEEFNGDDEMKNSKEGMVFQPLFHCSERGSIVDSKKEVKGDSKRFSSCSAASEASVFVEIELDNERTENVIVSFSEEAQRISIGYESLHGLEETCI